MKVQLYDDGMARVFDRGGNAICDVWNRELKATTVGIDEALKRIRMRRIGKWTRYRGGGFAEASVRFETPAR